MYARVSLHCFRTLYLTSPIEYTHPASYAVQQILLTPPNACIPMLEKERAFPITHFSSHLSLLIPTTI
jgi:hypothetical protein